MDNIKIEELKIRAEKNDINAQYELANIYFYGKNGVKENEKEAFYWYRQAAVNGHKEAFEFLENKTMNTPIVPIAAMEFIYCLFMLSDKEENKIKLEKIANSESSIAIIAKFYIGKIEFNKENYKKAFEYLKEVIVGGLKDALIFVEEQAEKNNIYCQEFLGDIYLNGSIEQTTQKAFYWYRRAVENGSELAFDILNKYSNRNDCYAQYELANIYYTGTKSIKSNYEQATKLCTSFTQRINDDNEHIFNDILFSNNSNPYIQFAVGQYYLTKNKLKNGFNLLIKSANQNNKFSIDFIKNFLENGDDEKQYIVAWLIETNDFEKQEILKPIDLYIKSAEKGYPKSIQKVFNYYRDKDDNLLVNLSLKISEKDTIISDDNIQYLTDIYLKEQTKAEYKEKIIKCCSRFARNGSKKAENFIKELNIKILTEKEKTIIGKEYYNTDDLIKYLKIKGKTKKKIKLIILLVLLVCILVCIIIAGIKVYKYIPKGTDYEKAEIYYERGKYQKAIKFYTRAAENGNANAQLMLGGMYYRGDGVEKNYDKAFKWLTKSIEQEGYYDDSEYYLQNLALENYDEATKWYIKHAKQGDKFALERLEYLAEQGNAFTQVELGNIYSKGEGVEQDDDKAIKWYTKAIEQGDKFALERLEYLAEQGNSNAQYELGEIYNKEKGVEQDYYKAVKFYTKAAENGNANAQYELGLIYYSGVGIEKDTHKGIYWYTKAAEQGDAYAQTVLGNIYVEQDSNKAIKWYTKAAERGSNESIEMLIYLAQNYNIDALNSLEKLAKQGNDEIQNKLGVLYYDLGKNIKESYYKYNDIERSYKSFNYFKKSAELGNNKAQYELGVMYYKEYYTEDGVYHRGDKDEAKKWLIKSAKQGNYKAKDYLLSYYHYYAY